MRRNNKKHLRKNPAALICCALLIVSCFVFPLYNVRVLGAAVANERLTMASMILDMFSGNASYFDSSLGVVQFFGILTFLALVTLYLLNGLGTLYNRYARYASFLTFGYFVLGLIAYNLLNNQYAASFFGFSISSISLGPGVYFVPLVGLAYILFARKVNEAF